MTVQTTRDQGKSMFIKEILVDDPDASHHDIVAAWQGAGMSGSISATLVSRVRSREGLARKRGRRPRTAETTSATQAAPKANARGRAGRLMELEVEFDRLLMKVVAVGSLPDVEDTLRKTRRQLYAGLAATL